MTRFPEAPGYYRLYIGDIEVICLSDGILGGDINAVRGVDVETVRRLFASLSFPSEVYCSSNCFVIRSEGKTALVDTGAGPHLYSTSGKLLQNLSAAGIVPAEIDSILFTHIHPDHCSGLLDAHWNKVFPDAVIKMHTAEYEFWLSDDAPAASIQHVQHEAAHVRRFLSPYVDQIELFESGEVFPGVTVMPLAGHTPGHTGYMIESRKQQLLIWGDIVHWPVIQFPLPNASMIYDADPTMAATVRRQLLETAAATGLLVAGMHLYFPGFTRVRRDGDGFSMLPVPWEHKPFPG